MKTKKTLLIFVLGVMVLISMSGMISATTVTFHPTSGYDDSNGGNTMTSSDLTKVDSSNDVRYWSKENWGRLYDDSNDYIDFKNFGISLPSDAIIDSVTLKFEWQRGKDVSAAKIKVWDASENSWHSEYTLTMPTKLTDQMVTQDLTSYITTSSDLSDLKVRFQAHNCDSPDNEKRTGHDLVEIVIEYHLPTPTCTLTVTEPEKGEWFDNEAVPVKWELSEGCTPIDHFWLYYKQDGDCTDLDHGWTYLADGSNAAFGDNPYNYLWDKPSESGEYCVKVKVTSNGARDSSEVFYVDHAKPEVSLTVGDNNYGDCAEESTGTCYVNRDTKLELSCTDDIPNEVWQSDVDYMEYRYSVNGGEFTSWEIYDGSFSFPEDSNHVLEYRCFDKVDKVDSETKTFVVESDAPELERTVTGPQVCPADGEECTKYFNLDTEICVNLVNLPEHEIPNVQITCDWWYGDNAEETLTGHHGEFTLEDGGCFKYTEDSYHSLECKVTDALENEYTHTWQDVVDAKTPVTTLKFEVPYYTDETSEWIDGVSTVVLTAEDQNPHPVEGLTTYYRYGVVDDSYCENPEEVDWVSTSKEAEGWVEYETPFTMEESCHVIEYYSVDALANSENVKHKFVFVDKTAPELFKEVGKPSHDCNGLWEDVTGECEEGWDYIVTTETPIFLSCEDQLPHPSGVKELCYRIFWDGELQTQNGLLEIQNSEGWVCVNPENYKDGKVPIYFNEECEHALEFYCVDNVGKTAEIDREVFKVEGKPFALPLDKKWNLISFPFNLLSNNVEEVFNDASDKIEGVWSYENGEWKVYIPGVTYGLTEVVPGRGYWVKTTEDTSILVGGELMSEGQMLPPSVDLDKGWNLIGHYGILPKPAYCSLFSLVDTQEGFPRWSALWGYNNIIDKFVPLDSFSPTLPGKGYWIEMDVEDKYSPATTCWGLTA